MLRQLCTRPGPAALLRPVTLPSAAAARPYRPLGIWPQLCYSNFAPQQSPYGYYPPPRSRGARLRDMALGSALTICAWAAYEAYAYLQFEKDQRALEAGIEHARSVRIEYEAKFAEARRAGDHERLRELTFEFARLLHTQFDDSWDEVGPLPGYPKSHRAFGKHTIPEEDTLMFINYDEENGAFIVNIAVNAEAHEAHRLPPGPSEPVDLRDGTFAELILRFNHQAVQWKDQGWFKEDDELHVTFILRDKFFSYAYFLEPDSIDVVE
ncbi:hypothetical protein AAE478_009162 [Parahypoxylon ruwenzoriense]